MAYRTTCPKAGCDGDLAVVSFDCECCIPLSPDGFSPMDAQFMNTQDERVRCQSCGWTGDLEYIEGEDQDAEET
jgi:hypothetical protein